MTTFDRTQPVAIIGAGVMGTKVAWACARAGLTTRLYDVEAGKATQSLQQSLTWGSGTDQAGVAANLTVAKDLDEALSDVQLAFENVPEQLDLKRSVLADLSRRLGPDAYLGTNASAITCTPLAEATTRPTRFFNLNFTDPRTSRLVELMTTEQTNPATIEFAQAWARAIGMVPIRVRREQLGYAFNRLWRTIKKEVLRQVADGYATPEDIDRAWMLTFGTEYGPCGMMDDIGLHTILGVERVYFEDSGDPGDEPPSFLKEMVRRGELGPSTGQGFYEYPGPSFKAPDFLTDPSTDE